MKPTTAKVGLAVILVVHSALLVHCAVRKSACYDEGAHLAAGLAYLRYGEMSIYNLSPPLLRYIGAFPAYVGGAQVPPAKNYRDIAATSRHWTYFDAFQDLNRGNVHKFILWGRFALMPLSLAAAILIYFWSSKLYGPFGGWIACAVWSFSPTVIAHGSTLGTDVGCATVFLFASWSFWRFLERPSKGSLLLAAILVALAPATKFTGLLIFPTILALLAIKRSREGIVGLVACAVMSFVVFNAVYGFRLMGDRLDAFSFDSRAMNRVQSVLPDWLPLPLHRDAVRGFDAQKWEAEGVHVSVLLDQAYFGSDWRFYPLQFARREPLALLAIVLLAVVSCSWEKPRAGELPPAIVLLVAVVGIVLLAQLDLWLRYLLPAYGPLAILCGRIARQRVISALLVAGLAIETIAAMPRFHSFTNLLTDKRGLMDCDWGQSLIELRELIDRGAVSNVKVYYMGSVDPREYDLESPDNPTSFAVSRSLLLGVPVKLHDSFVFCRNWRALRDTKPQADLGSMIITDIPPEMLPVRSWEDVLDDPNLLPIRNFEVRAGHKR